MINLNTINTFHTTATQIEKAAATKGAFLNPTIALVNTGDDTPTITARYANSTGTVGGGNTTVSGGKAGLSWPFDYPFDAFTDDNDTVELTGEEIAALTEVNNTLNDMGGTILDDDTHGGTDYEVWVELVDSNGDYTFLFRHIEGTGITMTTRSI